MDLAVKKVELINWLTRQDETMIRKVEMLRKSSIKSAYFAKMNEDLEDKLNRSQADIKAGRTHSQEEIEDHFKNKSIY